MRKLTDGQLDEMRLLFTLGWKKIKLAKKYNCSITTVALWLPDDETERIKKFNQKSNYKVKTHCYKCGVPYTKHLKCKVCEILLHGECDCTKDKTYYTKKIYEYEKSNNL